MALITRSQRPETPPLTRKLTGDKSSQKRIRFFDAFDREHEVKTLTQIASDCDINQSIGMRWL